MCLSLDAGGLWIPQQATIVITSDIAATIVTAIDPAVIGADTLPALEFTFAAQVWCFGSTAAVPRCGGPLLGALSPSFLCA